MLQTFALTVALAQTEANTFALRVLSGDLTQSAIVIACALALMTALAFYVRTHAATAKALEERAADRLAQRRLTTMRSRAVRVSSRTLCL